MSGFDNEHTGGSWPAEPSPEVAPMQDELLESARKTIGLFAEEIYDLTARKRMLENAVQDADSTLCPCRYEVRRPDCNCDIHAAHRILRAALEGKKS